MIRSRVAVLILNYNSSLLTKQCVESVLQYSSGDYVVIICDNGSTKEERDKLVLLPNSDKVHVIYSKINLGFSGGLMYAYQFVSSEYVLILNNDCFFQNDCIAVLSSFLDQRQQASAVTGTMKGPDGHHQHSFNMLPRLGTILLGKGAAKILYPRYYVDIKKQYQEPVQGEILTGSLFMVRSSDFDSVGGLDTNYFLYCEEEDLGYKWKSIQKECWYVPGANFVHIGGASTHRNYLIEKEFLISYFYFLNKHFSFVSRQLIRFFYFFKFLKKSIKKKDFLLLAFQILFGLLHPSQSLKHRQKLIKLMTN